MRILYITDQVYLHGGAEKILIQKLNLWVKYFGYEVMLITLQQEGRAPFFPINAQVKHFDLGLVIPEKTSFFTRKNIVDLPDHAKVLKRQIDAFKPDGIFLISLGFVRYILPFIAGRYPIYNEYHTSYYGFQLGYEKLSPLNKIKKKLSYFLIECVENMYTNIVFLNQAEQNHYKRKNGVIIPNFYDDTEPRVKVPKQKQVISLGRLSYQKGYDLLIQAWDLISEEIPGWNLAIFGNGEKHAALQMQISKSKSRNTIELHPATNEVNLKLAASSFYVMSSRFETFPMVLLEAMSNNLPVVSFDCPTGPASILTNGEDSILVENGNIAALAENIKFLMLNEDKRIAMGAKASENVSKLDPKIIMQQWDNLLRKNLKNDI